jgi:branched-chain amino acid transport system ATP-binding protein
MAAIGRGLMSRPKLMLLDEPSMGLAPMIVEEICEVIQRLNQDEGVSFLLAEQNAHLVLRYAHHGVVLENGRVAASGAAAELAAREDVSDFYLGGASTVPSPGPATASDSAVID